MKLFGLTVLAAIAAAADTACVDCDAPLLANADWSNGVLTQGNYYAPTKSGNWALGQSSTGEGTLELRKDPAIGNYVWNSCPKAHAGYCRVYINQPIAVQAGVTYDFTIQYAMDGVRGQVNILEVFVETIPTRVRLFDASTFAGNTNGWVDFATGPWTPTESADVVLTLTWYVFGSRSSFGQRWLTDDPGATILTTPSSRLRAPA